jgi:hypothetical protein
VPEAPEAERPAILVVSAWLHGAPPVLVARLTSTLDPAREERMTTYAQGADEIVARVAGWLAEVERARIDAPLTGE